ncbi:MAG: 30S ribosomal protein S17 [bacterium]|nr:30S ribosomal protein S17 [bacterium]
MDEQARSQPGDRKVRATQTGVVTSDKGDKTITVAVNRSATHRLYGKYVRRRTVLHVHDEQNQAKQGDRVEVMSCRPISKTKNWRLLRVVAAGPEGR